MRSLAANTTCGNYLGQTSKQCLFCSSQRKCPIDGRGHKQSPTPTCKFQSMIIMFAWNASLLSLLLLHTGLLSVRQHLHSSSYQCVSIKQKNVFTADTFILFFWPVDNTPTSDICSIPPLVSGSAFLKTVASSAAKSDLIICSSLWGILRITLEKTWAISFRTRSIIFSPPPRPSPHPHLNQRHISVLTGSLITFAIYGALTICYWFLHYLEHDKVIRVSLERLEPSPRLGTCRDIVFIKESPTVFKIIETTCHYVGERSCFFGD